MCNLREYIGIESKVAIAYWVLIGLMTTFSYLLHLYSTIHKSSEDKVQPKEADEVDEDCNYREFQND